MEKEFEAHHPGVDIQREAGGSLKCARKITGLKKSADILAVADYRIIDNFLIPAYADWNVHFAGNELVLCFTPASRGAGEISRDNWFRVIDRPEISWGQADPDLDPCGYRALLLLRLAEAYYHQPGLYRRLVSHRPERNIRPKSVELISLLQTGNLDYAWEYRSVAVQHGLKYLELPARINLSTPADNAFYRAARVKVAGKRPGETIEVRGQAITYGVTLLRSAPHRRAAEDFLKYLLSPGGGLRVLKEMGQNPLQPLVLTGSGLPEELRPLVGPAAE
jgi:molybdate/tungstate transport system substrate-binding protein